MKVHLTGDWDRAQNTLKNLDRRYVRAVDQAVAKEAHFLRAQIVKTITTSGAHADRPFAPLSPSTLIIRNFVGRGGGSKPLIQTGALRSSISVVKMGGGAYFVGVKRAAGAKGGANVAAIHEFGAAWSKPMTDRQRRFLHAAFRNSGAASPGTGSGVLTIKIPARPFVVPTVEKFMKPNDVRQRLWAHIAKAMQGDLGTP